eukprot:NODE_1208_length_581_cov_180.439850_g1134_i0.p2 GENE.NODE_1208_length_581_cov_180.439850_g1134_i0~~NODE_1208_length_581_cov_180.439850_g1134_i0.p2  ORF type:complete len:82 (-),score=5.73 NODE_1208_length_581_cov_180.439850_g1134_i0:75-320(-)
MGVWGPSMCVLCVMCVSLYVEHCEKDYGSSTDDCLTVCSVVNHLINRVVICHLLWPSMLLTIRSALPGGVGWFCIPALIAN